MRSLGIPLTLAMILLGLSASAAQAADRALWPEQANPTIVQPSHRLLALRREWRARKGAADLLRRMALFDVDTPSSRVLTAPRVVNGVYRDPTVGFEAAIDPGSDPADACATWPEWSDDAIYELLREAARQTNAARSCRTESHDKGE